MIQLALFPRPVEPEDLLDDVREAPFRDPVGLRLPRVPEALVGDSASERFGLGPVVNVPRDAAEGLRGCDRWGGRDGR